VRAHYRNMLTLSEDYWEIKELPIKGKGVFAKKDIIVHTVIGDYLGVITEPENEPSEDEVGLYTMWLNDRTSIFPHLDKIGIHLLNHSCAPNCWMHPYQGHTLFVALRHIFKGEELTISYLLDPPSPQNLDGENPCKHACQCGHSFCLGTFHTTQETSNQWAKFVEEQQGSLFNQVPGKYGEDLQPLTKYPDKIEPWLHAPIFGSSVKEPILCEDLSLHNEKIRQQIKETGSNQNYQNLNMIIYGVKDNKIFASLTK
jgi:uncharacterized protein